MDNREKSYLAFYSAAAALLFFAVMFIYTGLKLSAPLDDAFIYFQYAKNMAAGHFFEYVIGEGYTSGATSFLYVFLLTPFTLFLKGSSIVIITYVIGAVCLFYSGYFLYKTTHALTSDKVLSGFAAALFVTNGNILWGYFSGMEIGIFSTLLAANLYLFVSGAGIWRRVLFMSLLAMIRPEGFMMVMVFVFIQFLNKLFDMKKEKFLPYLIPLAAGFLYFFINYKFTGDFMPNTMRAKSNFSLNYFYYPDMIRYGLEYYLDFLAKIFNGGIGHYFPPYAWLIFLFGLLPGAWKEIQDKKAGIFIISFLWFFLGVMSTIFSSFATVHNYRYSMPFVIIFCLFLSFGAGFILEKAGLETPKNKALIRTAVLSLFIIFNVFTIWANAVNFGRDCRDIMRQSISAGKWVKANIPTGERVAINDAGAITYFSDAKVYDLVGLATNGQAKVFRDGLGTVFEEIEHVRPKYWMVHLGWFNYERFTLFKRPRMTTFNIDKEPPYYVVGSPEVGVETDFTLFDSGNTMKNDHTEKNKFAQVDSLDVADMRDEAKHAYRIYTEGPPHVPGTMFEEELSAGTKEKILEAGRITGGGEEFTVTGLVPGADLKIVRRVYDFPESVQKVTVDGSDAGEWKEKRTDKLYYEQEFTVSGALIKGTKARVKLEEKSVNRYNAFHYWFLQRRI